LDGLEGASAAAGAGFDRARMEATLSGLRNRVFLMHNVHEDEPVLFQVRWAMSYLRGPMTREQIAAVMADRKAPSAVPSTRSAATAAPPPARTPTTAERPALPPGIAERFLAVDPTVGVGAGAPVEYRPARRATARLHYVDRSQDLDAWTEVALLAPLGDAADPWSSARDVDPSGLAFDDEPVSGAAF